MSVSNFPCLLEHPEYRYDKLFLLIYVAVHLCIYTVTVSFCLSVYFWMSNHNSGTPRLIWLKYHLGFSVEPREQGKFSAWFKISDFTEKLFPDKAECPNYRVDFCFHCFFISTKYNTFTSSSASNSRLSSDCTQRIIAFKRNLSGFRYV